MQTTVAVVISLFALAQGAPGEREGKQLLYGAGVVAAPVVYHAPNCTTVDETVTVKQCAPKVENQCKDVEVPTQVVEVEESCTTFTVPVCKLAEVSDAEEAAEKVKREAEADPQVLLHAGVPAAVPYVVAAPVVPQVKCEQEEQESCVKGPVVKPSTTTINVCQVVTTVECTDIEHTVPKTTCVHATHVF